MTCRDVVHRIDRIDNKPLTRRTQVYALISREKTVLAEYTATSGNFPTVTRVLLAKIPQEDGRMSYVYDKYVTMSTRSTIKILIWMMM